MSEFRTIVSISPSEFKIGLQSGILTVGSCFAEGIGQRLSEAKFRTVVNPFGVIYNPLSIHRALLYAIEKTTPRSETYAVRGEVVANYDFHSSLSSLSRPELEKILAEKIGSAHAFLQQASWIMITYGSAFIFRRSDTQDVVANCHKLPAKQFSKSLLNEHEIVSSFSDFYRALKQKFPGIRIIITVSPVRHLKDTLVLNSVSKAVLRSACHKIAEQFEEVDYFPAYEFMMDDLRDYRFYASDMLHPSEEAERYIWEKFTLRYFAEPTVNFLTKWASIQTALRHRPFHPRSESHRQFLTETLRQLNELKSQADVVQEIAHVQSQLEQLRL